MMITHTSSKKQILSGFCLGLILVSIYFLWAVQPLSEDDWGNFVTYHGSRWLSIPSSGQALRAEVGHKLFSTNPFSLFKPGSLLTDIFVIGLFWCALAKESLPVRSSLTLILTLGFPYLAQIGGWNLASGDYGLAAVWMFVWVVVFRAARDDRAKWWAWPLLFAVSFLTSIWHEVWVVTFFFVVGFLFLKACGLFNPSGMEQGEAAQKRSSLNNWGIFGLVFISYSLALTYFVHGGAQRLNDGRLSWLETFAFLFNWPRISKTLLFGTKENLVLFKDFIPVFFTFAYIKFNKNFQEKFKLDFPLFAAASLGALTFMYVVYFLIGPIHWRARWLCGYILSATFFIMPNSFLINPIQRFGLGEHLSSIRRGLLAVAVIWFLYNTYFTYYYTNVDVVGWLQYRQKVLARDPGVLDNICCRTLPLGRPQGVMDLHPPLLHEWGGQDDRYRIFMGPWDWTRRECILLYWDPKRIPQIPKS